LGSGAATDAVETALRSLRHRDRSLAQLDRHLEARGFSEDERADALATLVRTDLADDRRFARTRAAALADRGAGNALVRHELAAAGVDTDVVDDAVSGLEPELVRAERIVARRGRDRRTARYLASKGFGEDVVYAAVARSDDESLG
jgi:regulatory protein